MKSRPPCFKSVVRPFGSGETTVTFTSGGSYTYTDPVGDAEATIKSSPRWGTNYNAGVRGDYKPARKD